jgi:hypothetical protein
MIQKKLTFGAKKNIFFFTVVQDNKGFEREMMKFTEGEVAYLMQVLAPKDCTICIWREREEEKHHCFSNGEAPCRTFIDKVFQGLEKANLI